MAEYENSSEGGRGEGQDDDGGIDYMKLVKDATEASTSYLDTNFRQKWEDNIRHFQCRHQAGSKYYKDAYKYRSKIFRPKTRSVIRSNEAAAVAAFFANEDVVSIDPVNSDDIMQVASAAIHKEILNWRMKKTIPWFMTVIGALQDGTVIGVICSRQGWEFEEIEQKFSYTDDDGNEKTHTVSKPIKDGPFVRLLPIENIRISPTASWIDPVNSSPYFIELIPMHLVDVKNRMRSGEWKKYESEDICRASYRAYDTTRRERTDGATDEEEAARMASKEYDLIWVQRNIFKIENQDFVFYTVGTELQLTEPEVLDEGRLYVIGVCVIEAHRLFPDSLVRLGFNLQEETNEVANQRSDNVKLVLNKRFKVKRGAQVDLVNLLRNVPGGAVLMDDPVTDVVSEGFDDVTSSAYMEQDRLNVDFDELMGTFSVGSVQSNRKLNETVGGMSMIRGNANAMSEYQLRTFAETWMEPVISQLVLLESQYESDEIVMSIAAQKSQLFKRFGMDRVTDRLLRQQVTTEVNVGMGATDPVMRLQRLMTAMKALAEIVTILSQTPPTAGITLRIDEIAKEIFANLGYKDGKRFLIIADQNDPLMAKVNAMIQQLQQQITMLQQQLADKKEGIQAKLEQTRMKEDGETERLLIENRNQEDLKKMDVGAKIQVAKIGAATDIQTSLIDLQQRRTQP